MFHCFTKKTYVVASLLWVLGAFGGAFPEAAEACSALLLAQDDTPEVAAEREEQRELVHWALQHGLLTRVQRIAIKGRLDNKSFREIAEENEVVEQAVRTNYNSAVARLRAFATALREGAGGLAASRQTFAAWLEAHLQARGWTPNDLRRRCTLSHAEFSQLFRAQNDGALEPVYASLPVNLQMYFAGRLAETFHRYPEGVPIALLIPQTQLDPAIPFREFVTNGLKSRGWSVETMRFLRLSRPDSTILTSILKGDAKFEEQKRGYQARTLAALHEMFAKFPPGEGCGAPLENETLADWLLREAQTLGVELPQSSADHVFWERVGLRLVPHREEVLRAVQDTTTEFSSFTRVKLTRAFRGEDLRVPAPQVSNFPLFPLPKGSE